MAIQIQLRRDLAANWTSVNPILASGEIGVETDTLLLKMGDGSTSWTSLSYLATVGATGATGPAGSKWYTGSESGAPSDDIGVNGDFYLNTLTGDVYTKISGDWGSPIENLTGPQGIQGIPGSITGTENDIITIQTGGTGLQDSGKSFSTDGTLASDSDSLIPTQKAIKTYADQLLATAGALTYKGATDLSGNPNYPAGSVGDVYTVSVAGKIGGVLGVSLTEGDLYICKVDNAGGTQVSVGSDWDTVQLALNNIVIGPSSASDGDIALYDGTTGVLIKDSGILGSSLSSLLSSKTANYFYAAPNGSSGVPTFRSIVASDIPTLNQNTTGSSGSVTGETFPASGIIVGTTDTQTLSSKRNTRRVNTTTSSATPSINTDTTDLFTITALSTAITSMTSGLSGTPNNGDILEIRILDNGTAHSITWGSSFTSTSTTLPTTTVISTTLRVLLEYNSASSKWECIGTT